MIIWWNVQLYNCMASIYSKQLATINLFSSSSHSTVEQLQQAQKMLPFKSAFKVPIY